MPGYFTFDDHEGNLLSNVSFENLKIGSVSLPILITIWNDKGNQEESSNSGTAKLHVIKIDDDTDALFTGTKLNGFKSMLEVRNVNAINITAKIDNIFTPININKGLNIAPLTVNSARIIEARLNIPYDATILDLCEFKFVIIE
jgi:hypothetical protein